MILLFSKVEAQKHRKTKHNNRTNHTNKRNNNKHELIMPIVRMMVVEG